MCLFCMELYVPHNQKEHTHVHLSFDITPEKILLLISAHRRHGSSTDLDDRSSDSGDPYLNDLHGMSRPRAPRRHTVGGNDLMNEGGRGDNQNEVSYLTLKSIFSSDLKTIN